MVFVGLVLGPALTLIVFNHLKQRKEILFDLSIIAVIQITALIWGGFTVYTQRPIALVYWANAFYTVTGDDYTVQGIESPDFSKYSKHIPPLIYSRPVATREELELSIALTEKSIPAYAHIDFYEPIEGHLPVIFASEASIWEAILFNPEMQEKVNSITEGNIDAYKYVPLKAKYQNVILIMKDSGEIVGKVKAPYRNRL